MVSVSSLGEETGLKALKDTSTANVSVVISGVSRGDAVDFRVYFFPGVCEQAVLIYIL